MCILMWVYLQAKSMFYQGREGYCMVRDVLPFKVILVMTLHSIVVIELHECNPQSLWRHE